MTARTALREMKALTDGINRNVVPRPPQWTDKEISQVCIYIDGRKQGVCYVMGSKMEPFYVVFSFVVGFVETIYSMGEE